MTTRPASRRRTRIRALGAAVAVVALVAATSPATAAGRPACSRRRGSTHLQDDAVSLRGTFQTPWVPRDGTWQLDLEVADAPPGARVEATLHPRIEDRETFNKALFGLVEGDRRAGVPPVELDAAPTAASGARTVTLAFSLRQEPGETIPGWAFLSRGLQVGVHPVLVQVVDADGAELTHTVAFLTRVASGGEPGADDDPLLVAPVIGLDLPAADETSTGAGAEGDGTDPDESEGGTEGDDTGGDDATTTTAESPDATDDAPDPSDDDPRTTTPTPTPSPPRRVAPPVTTRW